MFKKRRTLAIRAFAATFGLSFAALLAVGGDSPAMASNTLSAGSGALTITEGAAATAVAPAASIGGSDKLFDTYIEASLAAGTKYDTIGLTTTNTPNTSSGAVSVKDGVVYVGDGSHARRVGEVDSTKTGGVNKTLRINFDSEFLSNPDFRAGNTSGWTTVEQRINLGTDLIAGLQSYDAREGASGFTSRTTPDQDDAGSTTYPSNNNLVEAVAGGSDYRIGMTTYVDADVTSTDTVFNTLGAYTDPFTAHAGEVVSFTYRNCMPTDCSQSAQSTGDPSYRLWVALERTDGSMPYTQRWTKLLDWETDQNTNWFDESGVIPATGEYRIVVVSGASWAAANAGTHRIAKTQFRLDDFKLTPTITTAIGAQVLRLITYQNTSKEPAESTVVNLTLGNASGVIATAPVTIGVTDDPSTSNPAAPAPAPKPSASAGAAPVTPVAPAVPVGAAPVTPVAPAAPAEPPAAAPSVADAMAAFFADPVANLGALAGALFAPPNINLDVAGAVANPALGASGDDAAAPAAFDAMSSPESIKAISEKAVMAAAMAGAVAGAAAAGGSSKGGGSTDGGSGGGSTDGGGQGFDALEVGSDEISLSGSGWGDRLPLLALAPVAALDGLSKRSARRIARVSPMVAKLITDGAYLRAIFGAFTLVLPLIAVVAAVVGLAATGGALAAIPWVIMVTIVVVGVLDAGAGFMGVLVLLVGSIVTQGWPDIATLRMLVGLVMISIGPGLLMTAFRRLRREPQPGFAGVWERVSDFAIGPFIAGTVVSTSVSVIPAVSGLTMPIANHVLGFGLLAAFAAAIRVWMEEIALKGYPARLAANNPASLPEPHLAQKVFRLIASYFIWVLITGAIIGPVWQSWVGSLFFLLPAVIGLAAEHFPNSHWLWRLIPSGVPGLAFGVILSLITAMTMLALAGANPAFAQWIIVILPLPGLALCILSMFAKHGKTEDEVRWSKRNAWLYRIGGIVMLLITLRLMGVM